MMNELKKKDNYVVIPSNGTFILGTQPPIIKEDEYLNKNFEENIRVFGPYKVFSPSFQKEEVVMPVNKITEDADFEKKEDSFFDSISGTLGAAILGPVLGSAITKLAGVPIDQSGHITQIAKEAIHAGHIMMEVADDSNEKNALNNVEQKINAKNNSVRRFGVDGAIPDSKEMSMIVTEKASRTKFSNLSSQEQFESRHGGKIVYGKNGKK